jgi:hypothetical protein
MKNEKKKRLFSLFRTKKEQEAERERIKKDILEKMRPVLEHMEKQFRPLGTSLSEHWIRNNALTSSAFTSIARSLKEIQSRVSDPISDFSIRLTDINQKLSTVFLPTFESFNRIKPVLDDTHRAFDEQARHISMAVKNLDAVYKAQIVPERIISFEHVIITPPPPQVLHYHHHHYLQSDPISTRRINGYIYLDNATGQVIIMDLKNTIHHSFLPPTLIWILNALLDSPKSLLTKSMVISEGKSWNICMTKYHRINVACCCDLIQTGSEENSLRLNRKVIPNILPNLESLD